jgi:hypothetical protein
MAESLSELAISALRQKHAELAGQVIHYQREIARIREALAHIEAVLRPYAPDSPPEHILPKYRRPPRSEYLAHGEIRRRCLDAMREGAPITAEAVVVEMMCDQGLDAEGDRRLRTDLLKRTLRALDALRRRGSVEKIGRGRGVRWRLPTGEALE